MSFLGKTLTFQVFHPNLTIPISEQVKATVGPGEEFSDVSQFELAGAAVVNADFDITANAVHYIIDEPDWMFATTPGFNGYKLSDEDDTLAPITSVTVLDGPSALDLGADGVFFSENAIFIDVDGLRFSRGDTIDLLVDFGTNEQADQSVPLDIQVVARLYEAAFGRRPDDPGLNYWIDQKESGMAFDHMAASFFFSREFAQKFGAPQSLDDRQLVELLYENILSRPGEAAGIDYWVGAVSSGQISRPNLLIAFATSQENVAATSYVDDMARTIDGSEWIIA